MALPAALVRALALSEVCRNLSQRSPPGLDQAWAIFASVERPRLRTLSIWSSPLPHQAKEPPTLADVAPACCGRRGRPEQWPPSPTSARIGKKRGPRRDMLYCLMLARPGIKRWHLGNAFGPSFATYSRETSKARLSCAIGACAWGRAVNQLYLPRPPIGRDWPWARRGAGLQGPGGLAERDLPELGREVASASSVGLSLGTCLVKPRFLQPPLRSTAGRAFKDGPPKLGFSLACVHAASRAALARQGSQTKARPGCPL